MEVRLLLHKNDERRKKDIGNGGAADIWVFVAATF